MFSILIIIFSFKVINYNNNKNISHTSISPSATCALGLPRTQAGNPSTQGWADHAAAAAASFMACPAPRPGSQELGVRNPNMRASNLPLRAY